MKRFFYPDDDCVLCLTDRKKSATQWTDLSKKGNHGSVYGAGTPPPATPGALGYTFDGVDDYVNAGNAASLRTFHTGVNGKMTISAWINPLDFSSTSAIVSRYESTNNIREFAFSIMVTTGKLRLYVTDLPGNNAYGITSDAGVSAGIYSHIVVVYDNSLLGATNKTKIYINGVLVNRTQTDILGVYTYMTDGNMSTLLGAVNLPALASFFKGSIDEIRIYNRALSAAEILNYYGKTRKYYGV